MHYVPLGVYKLLPEKPAAGQEVKVDDIKGYMSIKEAAEYIRYDLKDFYKLFQIPDSVPRETKMKEIKNVVPGYDYEKIKESLK